MWCAEQGALPPRSEGTVVPRCCHHPSPVGAGVLSARRAGACLSPPRTSTGRAAAGPRTIFSSGSTSVCEGRGGAVGSAGSHLRRGWAAGCGAVRGCPPRLARFSPVPSRPAPLRCDASAKNRVNFFARARSGTARTGTASGRRRVPCKGPGRRGVAAGSEA